MFEEQLQAGEVLFLGHHLDDQVETFFLRLMRGAGVHGLAAIPRQRNWARAIGAPPAAITRSSCRITLARHGLTCIEDPSNSDTAMDRNFLRAELLPLLASRWPGYRRTVARASEHMAATAARCRDSASPDTVHSALGDPGVAVAALVGKSPRCSCAAGCRSRPAGA